MEGQNRLTVPES